MEAIARTGDRTGLARSGPMCEAFPMPRTIAVLLCLAGLLPVFVGANAAERGGTLTSCASIRALEKDRAALHLPVLVRGIVTSTLPQLRSFTVDDGTGIWVNRPEDDTSGDWPARLQPGDLVEIAGETFEGHFSPTISARRVHLLGKEVLPVPTLLTPGDFYSGRMDSQLVRTEGVVQAADRTPFNGQPAHSLIVATPAGRFNYILFGDLDKPASELVDAEVEITGVFLTYFNSRRQYLGFRVLANTPAQLRILRSAPANAFDAPETPLDSVMVFSPQEPDGHRRRIRGTVTLCERGHFLYVQDGNHALRVNTVQDTPIDPGDRIEASGFFQLKHHKAEMHGAVFRVIGKGAPPAPIAIDIEQALAREPRAAHAELRDFDDYLVSLEGLLVGFERPPGGAPRMILDCKDVIVQATLTDEDARLLKSLPMPGSRLRVSGVCSIAFSESRPVVDWPTPLSVKLLLRGGDDIRTIEAASWWTRQRLWAALGILFSVLLVALAWVALLRRTVALRSAELAEEMRARRDAAIEFDSTLRERNRLAADLHDTTEQSLTGLALQLEASEALKTKEPGRSHHHLTLARQLLDRSREDLRRSIWNLRANPLEKNTLSVALREIAGDRKSGIDVEIEVDCTGTERPLPDFVSGNLLLFAQEGITNALKHAAPKRIWLRLAFTGTTLVLEVGDDGRGFDVSRAAGPKEGHFGLQGMRERIKRLGGTLTIKTTPGEGTTIRASIPG